MCGTADENEVIWLLECPPEREPGGDRDSYYMECPLVGESFDNHDGTSRQEEIALCRVGEPVSLRWDKENALDPAAVAVHSVRGIQIGFLARGDNREALEVFAEERLVAASISGIYGGTANKPLRGVEVDLECLNEND